MHWAQDHQQCSEDPDLNDIANVDEIKEVLLVSAQWASLLKTDAEQVDTISKAVEMRTNSRKRYLYQHNRQAYTKLMLNK